VNGTRNNYVSSMCGIILLSGRDCPDGVHQDSALNLCPRHLEAAFDQFRLSTAPATQEFAACPVCGAKEMRPGGTGSLCARCGHQTDDFTGRIVTYAEQEARQESRTPLPQPNVVYYIQFGDRIKIGTSQNLRARLRGVPHDKVLGVERGNRSVEQARHNQFKHLRLTGEWFTSAPDLLEHIKNLHGPGESWYGKLADIEGRP
jgi:hypothetical protein